jgi:hypothetical protein
LTTATATAIAMVRRVFINNQRDTPELSFMKYVPFVDQRPEPAKIMYFFICLPIPGNPVLTHQQFLANRSVLLSGSYHRVVATELSSALSKFCNVTILTIKLLTVFIFVCKISNKHACLDIKL